MIEVDTEQLKRNINFLNPNIDNGFFNKIFRPNLSKVSEAVDQVNLYLKARFTEDNLTEFTYEILVSLFNWEAKIKEQLSQTVENVLPYINDGDIIYDIGANMGQFSRYLLQKKKVNIVMFEPVPLYRDYIRLVTAGHSSIEVVGKALSDSSGVETIYVDYANLGWNTLIGEKQTAGMKKIEILTTTLDEYIINARHPKVSFMKIDVEGAEFKVLHGSRNALDSMKLKPYILLEIGWGSKHPYWAKEVEEFEWLINNGWARFNYECECTTDVLIIPDVV